MPKHRRVAGISAQVPRKSSGLGTDGDLQGERRAVAPQPGRGGGQREGPCGRSLCGLRAGPRQGSAGRPQFSLSQPLSHVAEREEGTERPPTPRPFIRSL